MKHYLMLLSVLFTAIVFMINPVSAQKKDKSERVSPPAQVSGKIGKATISVDYSRPSVKGRKIWGDLVPYGKVWRTGANEATVFETSEDIKVNGQELKKGKYGLFTIPQEGEWIVIFNKKWEQWGNTEYNEKWDALRINVKPIITNEPVEQLTFTIEGDKVIYRWENREVGFTVK